jgi:hypothetical protein
MDGHLLSASLFMLPFIVLIMSFITGNPQKVKETQLGDRENTSGGGGRSPTQRPEKPKDLCEVGGYDHLFPPPAPPPDRSSEISASKN